MRLTVAKASQVNAKERGSASCPKKKQAKAAKVASQIYKYP